MQAMRSPDVWAENAPWVNASSGWVSTDLGDATGASVAGVEALELLKGNIDIGHKKEFGRCHSNGKRRVFSPGFDAV
jgi:hypothetical protein